MTRIALFAAALALSACATTATPVPASPVAALGEVAGTGGVRVRPLRVVEDSRCPMNARCIQAGRIIVQAEVSGRNAQPATLNLQLGERVAYGGGQLGLVSAVPERMAGAESTRPLDYRFTFEFTPG